ncbi:hypothetical protein [Sphingopyxis sp. JAI108]|uniref:hypothetical protein n=1 Tax=Sphingopyxis sp. JAI108 TaxID=2723060 RepID=UPI0015CDAB2E|nr:hypothetical protein [Sphingopyxis sp. JAI108]NYF33825.1 hypothetical protein [Sphingopyxis sp. JAI108]
MMRQEHADWHELTRSIHQNRAANALYYKPVCVIAAIDLADGGGLVTDMLHSELIIRQFEQYVRIVFPKRASKGWWPLWFLANDGLWNFAKKGKPLSKANLAVRPTTRNKTLERFDRQVIAPEYRALWDTADHRKVLRDHMLAIMNRYSECKPLVRALFDPNVIDEPEKWPGQDEVDGYIRSLDGQGDLFDKDEPDSKKSKGRSAAAVRKALTEFEVSSLPPASAVGPILEVTGVAPIAASALPHREVTKLQVALYMALHQKCLLLNQLASNSNRAAHLYPALGQMIAATQVAPENSNGYLIWSPGNSLRRLLAAELRGRDEADPDDPLLTDRMQELLADVVEQFNVYATTDGLIALLDQAKTGPAIRSNFSGPLDAGNDLVGALRKAPDILTEETTRILEAATQNAQNAKAVSGFDADQAVANAVEIQRNSAGSILRNAVLELKNYVGRAKGATKLAIDGAVKQLGAEIIKALPIASFVHSTRDAFIALWQGTTSFDSVNHFVTLVREFFAHYRG